LVRITSGLAVSFMVLAITIGMMPNPDSRTEYSKEPTISRNKGTVDIESMPSIELQPIEQSAPAVKAPPLDDSGE
jgi:preprotein translocase subunit SecG